MADPPEASLRRIHRELRALSSCRKVLMRATEEPALLAEVCRILCDEAGYRMAWVGYANDDPGRTVTPVAWAGHEDGYVTGAAITWADTPRGRGPTGTALRTGESGCIQDFETDPEAAPWREGALRRGYRSSTAMPLREGPRTFGVLSVYSAEPGAFTPDDRQLLEELAADVAFGVTVLRARAGLHRAEQERAAHLHLLESLDRINRAITGTTDLERMLGDVLDVVLDVLGCDRAFLMYPCDPAAPAWRVPVERTRPEHPGLGAAGGEVPMDAEVAATLRALLAADGPVAFGPGAANPVSEEAARRHGFRSLLSVAVHPKIGGAWHFGIHQCSRARAWTPAEERLVKEIGRRLADALSTRLVFRDLRASEERLAKAERMAHVGYWDADLAARRITLSEEAARIYGLAPEQRTLELEGWRRRWEALVEPADRPRVARALDAAAAGGPRYAVEYRVVRAEGEVRHVHSQGDLVRDAAGRPLRMLGTIQDITERKRTEEALRRSEEQYRRIVETAREGIWLSDAEGRTTFVNEQMAGMLGYSVAEMRGRPFASFSDEEGTQIAEQHELGLRRKDGSELWALVESTPFFDEAGGYSGRLAMVTDVTERRAMEAQLRQSQKLEAVGRLAGGVAHDFNNLLTAIMGDAQALVDGLAAADPLRSDALEIVAAAQKAALLTRQLLAFGRKQATEPRIVDLGEIVRGMERMLRRLIGEDVELTTSIAPGLGCVRADPVQLEQILLNLAVNARDAMPEGGRLVIEAANLDVPGGRWTPLPGTLPGRWVRLAVRDTGVGLSPDAKAHLFEPFFTTKEPGKGTGLGLATVYGIAKQAGGDVRARSEPRGGTAFEVTLPRVDAAAVPAAAPAPREGARAAPGGRERVLVVEDEPLVRALAVRVLRGAGYEVLEAGDAEQALALVAVPGTIDLLLTDVIMPRLSGPELAARLRALRPDLPVLFSSGYMDRVMDVQRQLGSRTAFIPKPFMPGDLARKVRELLDRRGGGQA